LGRNAAAALPDKVHDVDELKQRLLDVWRDLDQSVIGGAFMAQAHVCMYSCNRRTFLRFNLSQENAHAKWYFLNFVNVRKVT